MKAEELIGKRAIRTAPTSNGDYSYFSDPLRIINATNTNIVAECRNIGSKGYHIINLDCRWCDDNWCDYDELLNGGAKLSENTEVLP